MYRYITTCTCLRDFTTHGDVPCTCVYYLLVQYNYILFSWLGYEFC